MDIRFCSHDAPGNPSEGLCDAYEVDGIAAFDELLDAYRRIAAHHPGCWPLFTLDDRHQACYTCGHARGHLDLDVATEADIATLPAECFENGEYLGYMNTKAEFAIGLRNFRALAAPESFEQACAHGLTLDEQAWLAWEHYQADPLALLDQPLAALVVPVEQPCEVLAAFPNGYFSADLGPGQNYAVARHFASKYGYALIGVGASYLGLLRSTPANGALAQAVAQDMCALYNVAPEQRGLRGEQFARAIAGRAYLWVRYVE